MTGSLPLGYQGYLFPKDKSPPRRGHGQLSPSLGKVELYIKIGAAGCKARPLHSYQSRVIVNCCIIWSLD